MPTDYASLPLELRQKILHYSFYEPHVQDRALNIKLIQLNGACNQTRSEPYTCQVHPQFPHTSVWASVLTTTHPLIENDVHFVLRKALDAFRGEDYVSSMKHGLQEKHKTYSRWWDMTHVNDFMLDCLNSKCTSRHAATILASNMKRELRSFINERMS